MKKRGKILNWFSRLVANKQSTKTNVTLVDKVPVSKEEHKKKSPLFSLDEEKKTTSVITSIEPKQETESIRSLPIKPKKVAIDTNLGIAKKENKENDDDNNIKLVNKDEAKVADKKEDSSKVINRKNITTNNDTTKEEHTSPSLSNEDIIKSNVLDELDKMLKTSYYEIQKIKYDLDQLEKEEDEIIIRKEIDDLIYKLQKLIQRFEQIKKEFVSKNPNVLVYDLKEDLYIKELIEEYKFLYNNGSITNTDILQAKQISEFTHIIDEIIDIQNRCSKLNDNLDEKKKKDVNRDKDFDNFTNDSKEIDKINDYIKSFTNNQEHIIKELEAKIAESADITKTVTYKTELVVNYSKLLKATLLMATTPIIPPTRGGNLLKIGIMGVAIGNLANFVHFRTEEDKTIVKATYVDYEQAVRKNIDKVGEMSAVIGKAINDIKYLKKAFDKDFGEYANLIPEYSSMLIKLNEIEKDLIVKEQLTKEYNDRLDKALEKNNIKVKKIEEDFN